MFACNDKYYEEKMHFVKSLNILDHISSCVPLEFTYYSQMLYMSEQISEQIQFLSTATLTTTYLLISFQRKRRPFLCFGLLGLQVVTKYFS